MNQRKLLEKLDRSTFITSILFQNILLMEEKTNLIKR